MFGFCGVTTIPDSGQITAPVGSFSSSARVIDFGLAAFAGAASSSAAFAGLLGAAPSSARRLLRRRLLGRCRSSSRASWPVFVAASSSAGLLRGTALAGAGFAGGLRGRVLLRRRSSWRRHLLGLLALRGRSLLRRVDLAGSLLRRRFDGRLGRWLLAPRAFFAGAVFFVAGFLPLAALAISSPVLWCWGVGRDSRGSAAADTPAVWRARRRSGARERRILGTSGDAIQRMGPKFASVDAAGR